MTATMITSINEFFGQPLQQQFFWTSNLSLIAFACAIVLREFGREQWAKGCGRLLGLGGFFLLFCYAVHATDVATRMERLANDRRTKIPGTQIAETIDRPTETIVWRTSAGTSIRFTPANVRRRASVSNGIGRSRCQHVDTGRDRQSDLCSGGYQDSGIVTAGREASGSVRMFEPMMGKGF